MVMHPPAFATQKEEQEKWNEGFVAGVKEVIHYLEETIDTDDSQGPTRKWVEETKAKLINKYI
jgi:hypothetical protein